jgi:predicted MPP superfamily phosphohydrolase
MDYGRVNLLHISDLHYNRHWDSNQKIVYEAFLKDLRSSNSKILRPDIIIFSGDIVRDGDDNESFSLVKKNFIEPLLEDTGLDKDRFFLIPGNHDVQRGAISKRISVQESLEDQLSERDKLNEFYASNPHHEYIRQKLNNFLSMKESLDNNSVIASDLFFDACYVRELDIALACINTAWMSRGGLSDRSDRQHLLVPEFSVRRALEAFPETKVKILVGHHPLDWLADYAHQDMRRLLERGFNMYLHGHMHEPIAASVHSTIGHTLMHQSGALYTDRRRYNGYSLISVSPTHGHAQVNLRSFYERREQFDAAVDVVSDGRWYSSNAAKAFFERLPIPLEATKVFQWVTERLTPFLKETLDEGFGDRPVSETFVPPRLAKRSGEDFASTSDNAPEHEIYALSDLIMGEDNLLIVARPEFGKTTLLRQLALRIVSAPSQSDRPFVPCLVDFSEIKPGTNRFLRLLRAQLPHIQDSSFSFTKLLLHGHLVVLVDDVDLKDHKRLRLLSDFIKQNAKNRFIMTTDTHVLDQFDLTASLDVSVPFTVLRMEPFGRKEMRQLVERWDFKDRRFDRESILDRLVTDIVHINVPLTPVNGTILLTIFDGQGDFHPINKAVLIETFVETLLEKSSLREALRARFDFRNKIHLLSHLAADMAKEDRYRLPYDQLMSVSRSYFASVGLPEQSKEQIDHFISAKILEERDGMIGFRYRAFLEYFVAEQMKESDTFKAWVLSDDNYLSFSNEIGYYAGIRRSDISLLDLIGSRFEELNKNLADDTGWSKDLSAINGIEPPHEDELRERDFEEIERQLAAPQISREERDEILEGELPRDVGGRQDVFRPLYEDAGKQWTACLLLYSDIVKNSELVPDTCKRAHLSRVLSGWAQFTFHALLLVPALVKHRRVIVNGISYAVLFPTSWSDTRVARNLYIAGPRAISDLIRFHLGTEKLEVQLREPTLDEASEPLIVRFYRCALYGDLRLPAFPSVLEALRLNLRESRYLSMAYISKVRQMLLRLPLSREEDTELRKVIAGLVGHLLPGTSATQQRRASKEMQRLERQTLVRQLRIQAQARSEVPERKA